MSQQVKTQAKAAARPAPAQSAFQSRPFGTQSEWALGEEHESSNLFESYLQRRAAGSNHDFGSAPPQILIQPKLTLGPVGDKYEQEADQVAKQVISHLNAPLNSQPGNQPLSPAAIQRTATIQSIPTSHGISAVHLGIERTINQARGSGQPLAEGVRAPMEQAFGADFSGVRVHTDAQSDSLNRSLQARAFTTGQDIFFRQGAYRPHTSGGQQLLAHELTHVVQQTQASVGSRSEHPSSSAALQLMERPGSSSSGFPVIQRYGDKMTVEYEDLAKEEKTIQQLQEGLKNIYEKQKREKKIARDQLDRDYQTESNNVEQKQKYLITALKCDIFQKLTNDKDVQPKFSTQLNNSKTEKENMPLEPPVKRELDQQAANLSNQLIPEIKSQMEKRQHQGKKTNKAAWQSQVTEYARDFGRHGIADKIVQRYEQGYKDSAMNRKKLFKKWREFGKDLGFDLEVITEKKEGKVMVSPLDDLEQTLHIATVFFDEKRFIKKKDTPSGETQEIFLHRESGREYVQDRFGTYVKRRVKRALNQYDNPGSIEQVSIKSDPRNKKDTQPPEAWNQIARDIPRMSQEKIYEEIRNHQRQKELQGGSPFISFTTTDRAIFGSSGKPFEGEHGVAIVDLARIPQDRVFDTHTSNAMKQIHNVDDPNPKMKFIEGNETVERNSAARDAMRTREVVIAGDIPEEAIVKAWQTTRL